MKKVGILIVLAILLVNCKKEEQKVNYASFGAEITSEHAISKVQMMKKFSALKAGDTIEAKFASKVNKVCKAEGCWMKIDLGDEAESMVKFKDYGFFVPKSGMEGKATVFKGYCKKKEISVEELQHYAADAGEELEKNNQIISPSVEYSFVATGVLIEE